ncbi:MAG: hypothetical protein JNM22_04450 [Saprospiraceae bacterium]|nr:hypothetical protein [Saprospiraceae bacterium]
MRTSLFLYLLLSTAFPAIAQKSPVSSSRILDLRDALSRKVIQVEVTGLGGHHGECLKITCKNLGGQQIRVHFPQGQLMEPADSNQQTLVVAEEKWLAVSTKKPAEILLKTFCTQAGDLSPTRGSLFSVAAMAPETLCKVLQYISEHGKTEDVAAQAAVWATISRTGLGSIGDPQLTQFVALQLGKATPSYRIRHEKVESVPGKAADLGKALVVEGNFMYYLEKDEMVRMVLLDESGALVKTISKDEKMIAGEHRSGLQLQVWNLQPGKYIVRMQTKDGRVIKDMEVEF